MLLSVTLKTTALCLKLCSTGLGYILRPFPSLKAKKYLHKAETQQQIMHKSTENVSDQFAAGTEFKSSNVLVKSNLQHPPTGMPGHLTPFPARQGENLMNLVFPGAGI